MLDKALLRAGRFYRQIEVPLLTENEAALHESARVLQDKEVISGETVAQIVAEQSANA